MFKKFLATISVVFFSVFCYSAAAQKAEENTASQNKTLEVAQAFLWAAGSGDMEKLKSLMADDFVWHNEGDSKLPWIGNWKGKDVVLNEFFPKFGAALKTTSWTTDYNFVNGDQAVFMGSMSAIANRSGVDSGKFNWAVRVQVADGKVVSWTWLEDSYAISRAYHAKK